MLVAGMACALFIAAGIINMNTKYYLSNNKMSIKITPQEYAVLKACYLEGLFEMRDLPRIIREIAKTKTGN